MYNLPTTQYHPWVTIATTLYDINTNYNSKLAKYNEFWEAMNSALIILSTNILKAQGTKKSKEYNNDKELSMARSQPMLTTTSLTTTTLISTAINMNSTTISSKTNSNDVPDNNNLNNDNAQDAQQQMIATNKNNRDTDLEEKQKGDKNKEKVTKATKMKNQGHKKQKLKKMQNKVGQQICAYKIKQICKEL